MHLTRFANGALEGIYLPAANLTPIGLNFGNERVFGLVETNIGPVSVSSRTFIASRCILYIHSIYPVILKNHIYSGFFHYFAPLTKKNDKKLANVIFFLYLCTLFSKN